MSTRVDATGTSLRDALTQAIAEVAGCDQEKVELTLLAPGLDVTAEQRVTVRLDLGDDAPAPSPAPPAEREDRPEREERGDQSDRDERGGRGGRSARHEDPPATPVTQEDLDEEADAAADFLEGLLDVLELPGDLQIRVHEDRAEIELQNVGDGSLIGRRGQTLEAIQELVRSVLQRRFERRSRVQIDIEGYRARRLEKLLEKAEDAIDEVLDSGEAVRLEPMDVFERKEVHRLVTATDGVTSRSQGREPGRRVIIEVE